MSLIDTNKLTLFNGGEPLSMGYIYVGLAGFDPMVEANQQTVTFIDSQGNEFAAPQPLRTNAQGQIQWNGKAIEASIESDYSLLILNSNRIQIENGWIPTVSASSSGVSDLTEYKRYGKILSDIQSFNVEPGQVVGSVGKITPTDNLGATWLVTTNTGNPADDVDLVDFDNGLQGERIRNALVAWPIGSIYISVSSTNPSALFGGIWSARAEGRTIIGAGTGTDSNGSSRSFAGGTTGGEYEHELTEAEMPSHGHPISDPGHSHPIPASTFGTGITISRESDTGTATATESSTTGISINNAGSDDPHNNVQPYLVTYIWERTA